MRLPKDLSPMVLQECAELLYQIVRPGDHSFQAEVERAQLIFGIIHELPPKRKRRSFYGVRKLAEQWKPISADLIKP